MAGRPAQPVHQDPGDRRGPAGDHPGARRGHQRQRHADLLPGALPRGDGRVPRRPGAGAGQRARPVDDRARSRRSSSPASTPRSTSGSTRSAPTRPRRCAARPASPTPGWPTTPSRRCSARRWQALARRGRPPAAPAVGVDRRQGPGLPRHPLRRGAGRPRHGQHDAGGDAGRLRRPRRAARRHRPVGVRRRAAGARRAGARRHRLDDVTRCWRTRASRSSRRAGTS